MTPENGQPLALVPPIAVDAKAAARLFAVSEKTWRRLDIAGQVPAPIKLATCTRWGVAELHEWARCGCPARVRWERQKELTSP